MANEDLIRREDALRLLDENGVVFRREFEELPAVDAVQVIRCKDCIHWRQEIDAVRHWYCTYGQMRQTTPNYYCADGKWGYTDA